MNKPETLGEWKEWIISLYGKDTPAEKFFDDKIAKNGADDKVIAPDSQVLLLITTLNTQEVQP